MVYTIVVHLEALPVCGSPALIVPADPKEAVEKLKAKLTEAASVYRKDKEVSWDMGMVGR